jgi:hypothetical protein
VAVACVAEFAVELFEGRGAVALAGSLAAERAIAPRIDADHEDNARHLHLNREAERVELANRPRGISQQRLRLLRRKCCSIVSAGDNAASRAAA